MLLVISREHIRVTKSTFLFLKILITVRVIAISVLYDIMGSVDGLSIYSRKG